MTARRDVMHPYLRKFDIAYSEMILDDALLSAERTRRHHSAFSVAIGLFPASDDVFQENARILTYLLLTALL